MEAIGHAGACLGILTKDGVVLAAEKRVSSKLLDNPGPHLEKVFPMDDHIVAAVAGITADANTLIQHARLSAQQVC